MSPTLMKTGLTAAMFVFVFLLASCGKTDAGKPEDTSQFENDNDKISYLIGTQIGSDMKNNGIDGLIVDRFRQGVDDILADKDPSIQEDEMMQAMQTFSEVLMAKRNGTASDATIDYEKVSYVIGWRIGTDLKSSFIEDISTSFLASGLKDMIDGKESRIPETDAEALMTVFSNEIRAKQETQMKVQQEENLAEASVFLAENALKNGVVTLTDSLQYRVITAGAGEKPKPGDTVSVHYKGTFIDGTEFDSSYKRNAPAEFPVEGVIVGWQEALKLMPVGSKWEVFIPPMLGYGETGRPGIPPNKLLIFEMELLSIVDPPDEGQN